MAGRGKLFFVCDRGETGFDRSFSDTDDVNGGSGRVIVDAI